MKATAQSQPEDFSIQTIIKKYESRQAEVTHKLKHQKYCEDVGRELQQGMISGVSTPQFSHTIDRRTLNKHMENEHNQRTHKKQQQPQNGETVHMSFSLSNDRNDHQQLLKQLDQTEERLARSERNYAEIWRKYEKLLHERQNVSKEVEIEQKLRVKEQSHQSEKHAAFELELKGLKECLTTKEESVAVLKEKVATEERLRAQLEGELVLAREETQCLRAKESNRLSQEKAMVDERDRAVAKVQREIGEWKAVCESLQQQKKELAMELQKSYLSHKEELDVIKGGYLKVQEEYKQWIQQCNQEKIEIIEDYQQRINAAQEAASQDHLKALYQQRTQDQLSQREEQMGKLVAQNVKQTQEIKNLKMEVSQLQKAKFELVHKVSSLQNGMINRMEQFRALESAHERLKAVCKTEEQKSQTISSQYREMSSEFAELKSKCQVMFGELQARKQQRKSESEELTRLRKELTASKSQLDNYQSGEVASNRQLTESLTLIKTRLCRVQEQKQDVDSDLLAQRLENAKLREELRETKQNLKREYELSLESTRRQMLAQIGSKKVISVVCDQEKQNLYLQLRELQRRYELLTNQIVTVDEVIGLANKVEKRRRTVTVRK